MTVIRHEPYNGRMKKQKVTITLHPDELAAAKAVAATRKRSISVVIGDLLMQFYASNYKKKA